MIKDDIKNGSKRPSKPTLREIPGHQLRVGQEGRLTSKALSSDSWRVIWV